TAKSSYTSIVNSILPSFGFPTQPTTPWTASAADYSPVISVGAAFLATAGLTGTTSTGALQLNLNAPIMSIADGTSNTILLSEGAGRPQIYQAGQLATTVSPPSAGGKTTNDLGTSTTPWVDVWGGGWADASAGGWGLSGTDTTGKLTGGSCA